MLLRCLQNVYLAAHEKFYVKDQTTQIKCLKTGLSLPLELEHAQTNKTAMLYCPEFLLPPHLQRLKDLILPTVSRITLCIYLCTTIQFHILFMPFFIIADRYKCVSDQAERNALRNEQVNE